LRRSINGLRIIPHFTPRGYRLQPVIDTLAWVVALTLATLLRWDFKLTSVDGVGLVLIIPLAGLAQLVAGVSSGLYVGRWRFGSFDEVASVARATAITTALLFALDLWVAPRRMVPLGAVIAGGSIALVLMTGVRYAWRLAHEQRNRPGPEAARMLVFGAGEGGSQIITRLLRDPTSPFLPVALLDDDPQKRNLRMSGVAVVGGRAQMTSAAAEYDAGTVLIAIPSADAALVAELHDAGVEAGLDVKILPPVGELFNGVVDVADIREVTVADLLGRHEIATDVGSIASYLTGKRVLVTGAGGSIGSELCRQIYQFAPDELIMLDRDESALHAVQLSIEGRALLDSPNLVLLDIRDERGLAEVFERRRPHVVFHAAALKHLSLLEQHPGEAVKSNVWGTLTVLDAAVRAEVGRFVNISTDKAADPISVLGYSKRIGERLTAWFDAHREGAYLSVRFGNVLASRGSVLDTFTAQIHNGGPLTVTHPDVTRYFMTIPEAVELVIQAGAIGSGGEALVLDMGSPVRILDVARRLTAQSERAIKIIFTGLRPGEKLHEQLLGTGEVDVRPVHPLVSHVPVPPLDPATIGDLLATGEQAELIAGMARICRAGDVDARHEQ
jgi:FlaA1/EpsC-like NDP-sugar epimerase